MKNVFGKFMEPRKCPKCGKQVASSDIKCPKCGALIPPTLKVN